MGYKIKYILKKSKPVFIISTVLWVVLSVVLVVPISLSIVDATTDGNLDVNNFMTALTTNLGNIFKNMQNVFNEKYIHTFLKSEAYLTIALFLFTLIGFIRMLPKNEYTDIEHGSSDWAEKGEQYKILHPRKGILLAEKNYLPVDKRGNTNVLVVGRFRFW